MRNSIAYTAVLTVLLSLGTVSTSFAEQPKSTTKDSSDMMKGKDMPMMDMKQMSEMVKNCNTMMESMSKHMQSESPQGGSKVK